MNMTGGFSSMNKADLDILTSTSHSFMKKGNISIEDPSLDDLPEQKSSRTSITQVPFNSSKIDFKLTFPTPSLRKKMASQMK